MYTTLYKFQSAWQPITTPGRRQPRSLTAAFVKVEPKTAREGLAEGIVGISAR